MHALAAVLAAALGLVSGTRLTVDPAPARVGEAIAAVAQGLEPGGPYELSLVAPSPQGSPSTCLARVGSPARARGKALTFRGSLPGRLRCLLNDGSPVSEIATPTGRAILVVCAFRGRRPLCDGRLSTLRLTSFLVAARGRACRTLVLAPATEAAASSIRASGVGCETARIAAAGSEQGSGGCFRSGAGRCSYRAVGFLCHGARRAGQGVPSVDFRCARGTSLVTFIRT